MHVITVIIFVYSLFVFADNRWTYGRSPIASDAAGYYFYLPLVFIHKDVTFLSKKSVVSIHKAQNKYEPETWFMNKGSNGNAISKYPMGVAIFEAPLFVLAHAFNALRGDIGIGYETSYKISFILTNLIFSILGLWLLFNVLMKYFSTTICAITVLSIALCTNYQFYATWYPGMSHIYSFFLVTLAIKILHGDKRNYFWVIVGLLVIVRPTNILFGLLYFLWDISDLRGLKMRFHEIFQIKKLISASLLMIPVAMQMLYWKLTVGSWIFYSYTGEFFDFFHPHLFEGLFGFRKGLFVYSPILFFVFLGFLIIYAKKLKNLYFILPFFILFSYIVFSWTCWWYGGGFGARPIIEFMPLLAFPFAVSIQEIYYKKYAKYFILSCVFCAFLLNVLQGFQYKKGIIHCANMNSRAYKYSFLKLKYNENEKKYFEEIVRSGK